MRIAKDRKEESLLNKKKGRMEGSIMSITKLIEKAHLSFPGDGALFLLRILS